MPEIVKAEPEIKEFLVDAKYRDQVTLVDMERKLAFFGCPGFGPQLVVGPAPGQRLTQSRATHASCRETGSLFD
jgi:hypothetical protein